MDDNTRAFVTHQRIAHLATASLSARPVVVPICYAFDGENIYSPLDEKPKSADVRSLKRVRNIEANPQISLVMDEYSEDWSKLIYVLISGVAEILEPGDALGEHMRAVSLLREKYTQYGSMAIESRPMIKISALKIKRWSSRTEAVAE
jgi:PPOX class probable F420-dependent enzyme